MTALLLFSRDPGPTNQLVATVETLRGVAMPYEPLGLSALRHATRPVISHLRIAARPPGDAIWRAGGYTLLAWGGRDDAAAGALIDGTGAQLVLTGANDVDEPTDRALWRAARARGVESHTLLDHPANLTERFADGDGRHTYPDWLYVADETFASRLVAAGAPARRIRIIGDLHHARLARLARDRSEGELASLRAGWGAARGDFIVLFASECAREMAARGRPSPYDEIEVLVQLLGALNRGEHPRGGHIDPSHALVVVRPHPRDEPRKYVATIARHSGRPRVVVSADGAPEAAVQAADLVVGMNSSLLYEALVLGRAAVSLVGRDLSAGKSAGG